MRKRIVNVLSVSGLLAMFVGNGIGRFAYIALMPALIQAGWFSKSEASYLGVATLVGYLFGAPLANLLAHRYSVGALLRFAMLVCAASYCACALQDAGLLWALWWRALGGVGGAMLMVLAPPVVLQHHVQRVRGRVGGIVFSGIGLGAMLSGVMIPLLVSQSITAAWLGMGYLCLVLALLTSPVWDVVSHAAKAKSESMPAQTASLSPSVRITVGLILLAYVLNAVGYLPHTLFWVDYIVRELKLPLATGGFFWAVFGVGAAMGPLITGHLGDLIGFKRCLLVGFALKALGVALPLIDNSSVSLFLSSFLVGAFTPGIATLVSTYTLACVGPQLHRKAWSWMTFSFAASQAGVGFLMALIAANSVSYRPLFLASAAALMVSALCIACTNDKTPDVVGSRVPASG